MRWQKGGLRDNGACGGGEDVGGDVGEDVGGDVGEDGGGDEELSKLREEKVSIIALWPDFNILGTTGSTKLNLPQTKKESCSRVPPSDA